MMQKSRISSRDHRTFPGIEGDDQALCETEARDWNGPATIYFRLPHESRRTNGFVLPLEKVSQQCPGCKRAQPGVHETGSFAATLSIGQRGSCFHEPSPMLPSRSLPRNQACSSCGPHQPVSGRYRRSLLHALPHGRILF